MAAFAHARLVISNPAPGAVLDALPATVDLVFSEPVTPAGRGIDVYGPDGRLAQSGSALARGDSLSVGLTGALEGTYAVVWMVIASDTHPSRGEFTFSVGHTSPVRAPGLGGGDVGLVSPVGLVLQALGRWLHFAGFALGFGSVDPTQTFDGDALTGALASSFGRVLGLRLAAALFLWALLGALRQAPRLRWAILGLGVALAFVDATAAHATPSLPQPLGLALNALHVAAMGMWLGGLAAFALAPAGGFGRVAAWSAGLLVVSGAALALIHFASPLELVTTAYGASLLVKLPLVGIALLLAWRARRRWELVAMVFIVAAASVLTSLPPPR